MTAHVAFGGKLVGVDDIEVGFLLGKEMFHAVWHGSLKSGIIHICIKKESTTNLEVVDDVELEDIGIKGAGDEVCVLDVVFAVDWVLAETEVGTGGSASLTGVILEVGLSILSSSIADDLDGALVGGDGTIGT